MIRPDDLDDLLRRLLAEWESECVEFKAADDNFSTSEIGKYFSALSNEANLREREAGWLVFGVRNKTREIIGTDYRQERERLHGLKHQIAQSSDPTVTFREIHEFETGRGRVVLFEIPPAPRGIPIAWNGHYYARDGESLGSLGLAKLDEIRAQGLADDWSALVVADARLDDLDSEALTKARTLFAATLAQSHRLDPASVAVWSNEEFLENAGLARRDGLTRACLLLLGKPRVAALLNPYAAEMTWKLEGDEIAYEHFPPPFLLNTSRLFQRIRNLRLSLQPPGQLIPVDIAKYDEKIVLEALHNCIAHQDYHRRERVLVIERAGELVFENAGEFYDGAPDDYIRANRTPRRYRNLMLATAMRNLRMMDTLGLGIREVMWKRQAHRYMPLPDYDLGQPGRVRLRLPGRFIDENFSRALIAHADLPWPEVLALDAVQKGGVPDDDMAKALRRRGLVEGRKPRWHVAAAVASATETEVEYLHHRGFDDAYYCDLILDYLKTYGSAKRAKFNRLLENKLSDLLNPTQKRYKIGNLLKRLQGMGKIKVSGYGKAGVWELDNGAASMSKNAEKPGQT